MADRSRHRIRPRKPGRPGSRLSGKPRILILCDGAQTEPNYFRQLKNFRRLTSVAVRGPRPRQIGSARLLKRVRDELKADAGWDHVYCVVDHDGHDSAVNKLRSELEAINRRRNSPRVHMALSNPCFELWLLLHFEFTDRPYASLHGGKSACDSVIERLRRHIPGYRKNEAQQLEQLMDLVDQAIHNANRLERLKASQQANSPHTDIGELAARLLKIADS